MSVDLIMIFVLIIIVLISIAIIFGTRKIIYIFMKSNNSYSCDAIAVEKKEVILQSSANPRAITSYSNNYIVSFKIGSAIRSFYVDYAIYDEIVINGIYYIVVEANEIVEFTNKEIIV